MRITVAPLSLALAALVAACATSPRPAATTDQPSVAVTTATVDLADIAASFEAGGVVRARTTAVIASRVMAPVVNVHVRAGDRVRLGAPLVTLDAREMRASTSRASAALASAEEAARAAESDTRAAEAALRLARVTHERIASLFATRSATAQELDQAVAALAVAEAQVAAGQQRLAAANAGRDAARASAEVVEIGATYAVLTAPFDGIVAERTVDPGSLAAPGAALLTLEDAAAFRLDVQLDEARAALIRAGQAVEVMLAPRGTWTTAHVSEIARLDSGSHSFVVKVDLPGDASLRSGLFGRVRFPGPARRTLVVPTTAILRRGQLAMTFAVDSDSVARIRALTIGTASDGRTEILAGLHQGDRIVVEPPAGLSDGARVSPRARTSAEPSPAAGGAR